MKLAHDTGITQKSAWCIAMRIREAYQGKNPILLEIWVEVDEGYAGGVKKNRYEDEKQKKGLGAVAKLDVLSIKERGTNRVIAQSVKDTTKETLQDFIQDRLERCGEVCMDEYKSYTGLEEKRYEHETVKPYASERVRKQAHTNGIESFWALLSRSYHGTRHWVSMRPLESCMNEFVARSNIRGHGTVNSMQMTEKDMLGRTCWEGHAKDNYLQGNN